MKDNIEKLIGYCSGCGSCSNICPVKAIKYELNEEGFWSAKVDTEKCINCGKCIKVCLKNNENLKNTMKIEDGILYYAYSKDNDILKKTTSGGIAYHISNWAIENDYYVIGVIYNYKKDIAETVVVKNKKELKEISGSKYLQSKSDNAIKDLIEICKKNPMQRFVIFGTPCQIFGIKKLLEIEKITNEVVYIDLFCHGVPSYLVWNKYLDEFRKNKRNEKIKNIEFRNKKYGWGNFVLKIETDKKVYYNKAERDNFFRIFFDNAFLNKSCESCELRKGKSLSDIRLGDFWHKKFNDNNKGVSAILINTSKGKEIINKIKNTIEIGIFDNLQDGIEKQSKYDIQNQKIREICKDSLLKEKKLNKVIKEYQKFQPISQRYKQQAKIIISFLPLKIKKIIKKII